MTDERILVTPSSPLPEGESPGRCVYVGQGMEPAAVLAQALSNGYRHVVQSEASSLEGEIDSAVRMMGDPVLFLRDPLQVILGKPSEGTFRLRFNLSAQKEDTLISLRRFLESMAGTATVMESAVRVADELFTNAIFNAPADLEMNYKNKAVHRATPVELPLSEAATLLVGSDRDWLVVGCTDPFGSLVLRDFLVRIRACYEIGVSQMMNSVTAGAGIGCHSLFDLSVSFYVGVQKGKKTAIFCKLPLNHSHRASELMPKSLHICEVAPQLIEGEEDMPKLKIDVSKSGNGGLLLKLAGGVDEDAVFGDVPVAGTKEVEIDFQGVTSLNSCGIREWVKWIKTIPGDARISFVSCPKSVVDQMNLVDGFLPAGASVRSFQVPYFCEKCEKAELALFSEGKEFQDTRVSAPARSCGSCGQPMELDVIQAKYFRFLQKR